MADFERLHADAPESLALAVTTIEGTLPQGLSGTLLRNGPGIQGAGSDRFHLLDGYGFVAGLTIANGSATLRARHVKTRVFEKERAAGRQLGRKVFTNMRSRWANLLSLEPPNVANHDVYAWGGRIVACDAPGHVALDEKTLETVGPSALDSMRPGKVASLCAMPRVDPATNRLVAYSVKPGLKDAITWYELDAEWRVAKQVTGSLGASGVFLHDLAFTPHWYVATEVGRLNLGAAAWGARSLFDAIGPGPGNARRLFLFSREDGSRREAVLPAGMQAFHLLNAFEDGDDVLVDLMLYPRPLDFNVLHPGGARSGVEAMRDVVACVTRVTIPPTGEVRLERYEAATGDAPLVNPATCGRRTRVAWLPSSATRGDELVPAYFYAHGTTRLDLDTGETSTWSAGPRVFCGPPAFAPRPGGTRDDDGWLLVWAADAERDRSLVFVLDAANVAAGPVATLDAGRLLPAISHVEFVPGLALAPA